MKIAELTPRSRNVDLVVTVVEKKEPRTVLSRKDGREHELQEVVVADDTGSILMSVWDGKWEVEEGKNYRISNGYVTLVRGSMRLSLGRYGKLEETEEPVEANLDNNMSEKSFRY